MKETAKQDNAMQLQETLIMKRCLLMKGLSKGTRRLREKDPAKMRLSFPTVLF